jgi:hypothetical protein
MAGSYNPASIYVPSVRAADLPECDPVSDCVRERPRFCGPCLDKQLSLTREISEKIGPRQIFGTYSFWDLWKDDFHTRCARSPESGVRSKSINRSPRQTLYARCVSFDAIYVVPSGRAAFGLLSPVVPASQLSWAYNCLQNNDPLSFLDILAGYSPPTLYHMSVGFRWLSFLDILVQSF